MPTAKASFGPTTKKRLRLSVSRTSTEDSDDDERSVRCGRQRNGKRTRAAKEQGDAIELQNRRNRADR